MTALRDLLDRLATAPGRDGGTPFADLADDPRDWVVALCTAWARQAETVRF
jgi:hypothetical protein